MSRFQRQILLPEVGADGQNFLANSKVLIVGAGGLGNPALQYLVSMGVGEIGVVDGDTVRSSNLHRQVLFSERDIGLSKVKSIERVYSERKEPVKIIPYPFFLQKAAALELFPKYDVIVDGTDNFQAKLLINDVSLVLSKPVVYGAISKFEGQVSVFWKTKGPCYRCLVPDVPKAKIQDCAQAGVIGAVPGIVGSIQAIETFKVLINIFDPSSTLMPSIGVLQHYDFARNAFRNLKVKRRSGCRCESLAFQIEDIVDIQPPITECELNREGLFLDVREQEEWNEFHVPSIAHLELSRIEAGEIPLHLKDRKITTICLTGTRAQRAAALLAQSGFDVNFTHRSIYGIENRREQTDSDQSG